MKQLLLITMAIMMASTVKAQRLVIGSDVPDIKDVEWLSSSVPPTSGPMLIEFYQASNPTSVKLFDKLAAIYKKHGQKVAIVVLSMDEKRVIEPLAKNPYCIGYDAKGGVFAAFGVKFTPFTMVVNSKGDLFWQGNLNNITDSVLESVK